MKVLLLLMLVAIMRLGVTEDGEGEDVRPMIPCKDGSGNLVEFQWCDGYCGCDSCEDEAECDGGIGITSVEWGDMAAKLNAKLPGGKVATMTHHLPWEIAYAVQRAWACIFHQYCY